MGKSDGTFVMPFGKYVGKTIEEIPSSYLNWLRSECDNEEVAEEADNEYSFRTTWNKHWN